MLMGAQSSSRISPVNDFTRTEYEITIPGNEIPIWFNHQYMGNYVSFWIGPEIPTFALCVAFGMENASGDFYYQVDMSINGSQRMFVLEILEDCIVFLNEKIYISALYRRHKCAVQVKCSTSISVLYK